MVNRRKKITQTKSRNATAFRLSTVSRIGIGGTVRHYARATTVGELIEKINAWRVKEKTVPFVIGDATNILFSDKHSDYCVIQNKVSKIIPINKHLIFVASGTLLDRVVDYCLLKKRSGLSWAAGIPGTVGGAIYGNAGAFGGDIGKNIIGVVSLEESRHQLALRYRDAKKCLFGYRNSFFKREKSKKSFAPIILGAYFYAPLFARDAMQEKALASHHRAYRIKNHPMRFPTLGSTFKNVPIKNVSQKIRSLFAPVVKHDPFPIIPVGALLERAECKGMKEKNASFSTQHANFIITKGKTRAKDVKKLITRAQKKVFKAFRVVLEPEIIFLK